MPSQNLEPGDLLLLHSLVDELVVAQAYLIFLVSGKGEGFAAAVGVVMVRLPLHRTLDEFRVY